MERLREAVLRGNCRLFLSIILTAMLFCMMVGKVQAATLLSEDFSSGNYNNWHLPAGSGAQFSVISGELRQTNTGVGLQYPFLIYQHGYSWTDYDLTLKARHVSGFYSITDIRIYFRMQSNLAGYFLQLHGLGYVALYKRESSGTESLIYQSSVPFSTPNYSGYTVRVKVEQSSIKAWVDGTLYIDVTDNSFSQGTIGLGSTHVVAGFDDVVVNTVTSTNSLLTKIADLPVPVNVTDHTAIFDNNTKSLYFFPSYPTYYNQIYKTTHDTSDVISWSQVSSGPYNWNYWGRPDIYGSTLYFSGAFGTNSIYKSAIGSSGSLGSWTQTTSMPAQYGTRSLHQTQAYNGKFYVNGGWWNDYGPAYGDIHYATINSDGTLGSFTQTGNLPFATLGHSTYINNGNMYFVHSDKIYRAPVSSGGSVGTFTQQSVNVPGLNHSNYGTRGIVILPTPFSNYLVISDYYKTHICSLDGDGNVTSHILTTDNPATFGQRYVYLNNGKVYILADTGLYRLEGFSSLTSYPLTVTKSGTGSGTVTSSPSGINCGSTCSASFSSGTSVTLTATAASGSTFAGWSGACSGTSSTCTVTMDGAKNVTATFNTQTCTYSINPTSASVGASNATGSITVTASSSNCSWTATSNASWITITSGSSGTGNGTVNYSVTANTSTTSRTGTITVAGLTFTITQGVSSGLTVTLSQIDTNQCPTVKGYVTVNDGSGRPITGLTTGNFTVKEDGVVKTPITVTPVGGSGTNISVGLTMDYSGSMSSSAISNMETAAVNFINLMSTGDAMEVVKFSSSVEVVQSFTTDKQMLTDAVRRSWSGRGGMTALYDAVYLSLTNTKGYGSGRSAVIAMTDGYNNSSSRSLNDVINYARANGIPIYSIGFGSADTSSLQRMATETGGRYYYAPDSSGLQAIYQEIANILNNQYVVSYQSSYQDGLQHTMEVEVSYQGSVGQDSRQFTSCGSAVRYTLQVFKTGIGDGVVTSNPSGINCGSSCSAMYGSGVVVELSVSPSVSNSMWQWTDDCSSCGTSSTCRVTMNSDKTCRVAIMYLSNDGCYSVNASPLRIGSAGGTGTVVVNKVNQSCPNYEWYAVPDVSWIKFPQSCVGGICDADMGSGIGAMSGMPFKLLANSGTTERSGQISLTMMNNPIVIWQDANSCTSCGISFNDVSATDWAKNYIMSIACAGITVGCGNNNYCGSYQVTRAQMAAFIVRAKEGEPPAGYCGGSSNFNDVSPNDTFCGYIKRLGELQITQGCGNGNYCPSQSVTRGQMAAFIIRALYGENFSYTTTPYFSDVPSGHVFFKYVQKMKDQGYTTVSGTYLVDNPVSRSEMAAFLYRAFLQQNCGVISSNVQSIMESLMGEIGER